MDQVFSATVVDRRHVITAGHVAKGNAPGAVVFNLNYGGNLTHQIQASAVYPHPSFVAFNTPDLQHDIALIELAQDVPAALTIYPILYQAVGSGATITLVGYGASGQGNVGISVTPDSATKRSGRNNADSFALDVDGSGRNALYFFDFDGGGAANYLGGGSLGNTVETTFAYGDSGSPAFVNVSGQWRLAGVNTFVSTFSGGPTTPGTFGTAGGGNLLWPYQTWIQSILSRPENDNFVRRTTISGASGQTTGANTSATKEGSEPNHAANAGGRSVWWRWTAPSAGQVSVDTQGSAFNTLLAVYTGSTVNALTLVAENDNVSGTTTSAVTWTAQAGTQYQIAVDGFGGAQGAITVRWRYGAPSGPANDDVPTLSEWGAIVMALTLLLVMLRKRRALGNC